MAEKRKGGAPPKKEFLKDYLLPARSWDMRSDEERIKASLQDMPEKERIALELRFGLKTGEHLSAFDVSLIMGCSRLSVEHYVLQGLLKLGNYPGHSYHYVNRAPKGQAKERVKKKKAETEESRPSIRFYNCGKLGCCRDLGCFN